MKKSILALVTLFSSSVMAETYVGAALHYQDVSMGNKNFQQIQVAGENLNLANDNSQTSAKLFAGYRFSNNFGVELGYSEFALEAGKEVVISALQDEEWEAEFNVNQLDVQLTYFYPLNEKLSLKTGLGVVYHDTDFNYSHKFDNEDAPDQYLEQGGENDKKLGVTGSVSLNYNLWKQVDAQLGVQYSNSSLADNTAAFAGLSYRF